MSESKQLSAARAALRDARKYIDVLETQVELLRIELAERGQPLATMRDDDICVQAGREACEALGIDYYSITERGPGGNLYRDREAVRLRAEVAKWLLKYGAERGNQFSSWDIARAIGYRSHSQVLAIEKQAMELAMEGACLSNTR